MKKPAFVVWLSGLSGSGKSTLARLLAQELDQIKIHCRVLDGDGIRAFFDNQIGYSRKERELSIKCMTLAAKVLSDEGVPVIVANICPYEAMRQWVAGRLPNLALIYLKASLETCRRRENKGVYEADTPKVGIDEPFEPPQQAALTIDTEKLNAKEAALRVITLLQGKKWI